MVKSDLPFPIGHTMSADGKNVTLVYHTESDSSKPEAVSDVSWGRGIAAQLSNIQHDYNVWMRDALDAPPRRLTWWERHRPSWWPFS